MRTGSRSRSPERRPTAPRRRGARPSRPRVGRGGAVPRRPGAILVLAALAGLLSRAGPLPAQIELPPGPGRDLVYGKCRTCHDLQYLKASAGITRDDWDQMLISMRQYGLRIPPDQRGRILDYLGTYLGPSPPPGAAAPPAGASPETTADGATVFQEQCTACHQPQGQGVPGQFPPLATNRDLFLSRTFPALVVLFGMRGEIEVRGERYRGQMPSFGHLSDAAVAAVVAYVRGAWGNEALRPPGLAPIDAAAVAEARREALTSDAVHAQRQALR